MMMMILLSANQTSIRLVLMIFWAIKRVFIVLIITNLN